MANNFGFPGGNFPNQNLNRNNNVSFSRNSYTINTAESRGYSRVDNNQSNFSRNSYSNNTNNVNTGRLSVNQNTSTPEHVFTSIDGRKFSTRDQAIQANQEYYRRKLNESKK